MKTSWSQLDQYSPSRISSNCMLHPLFFPGLKLYSKLLCKYYSDITNPHIKQ